MSLTVCLLTRNDEARLSAALTSVIMADEIIVADTGSTDGSVNMARSLGARIVEVDWDDDFSKGRNQAIAEARGDWILWLNPDEELDARSIPLLNACVQQPDVLAFQFRVQSFSKPEPHSFAETLQPRLFRNGHGVAWRGRLHPAFDPALDELARTHKMRLLNTDVRLRHHAYLSQVTPEKLRWAVRLLEKELQDRPNQLHYLIELGSNLMMLRDPRGRDVLRQAATMVAQAAGAPTPPSPAVGRLFEFLLNDVEGSNGALSVEQLQTLAERWFANTPPVLWSLALRAFRSQDFDRARTYLDRLVQLGETGVYDRRAAFEPAIIGGLAWLNLGVCWAKLGDLPRAEQCFARLLSIIGFEDQGRQYYAWTQQQRRLAVASA